MLLSRLFTSSTSVPCIEKSDLPSELKHDSTMDDDYSSDSDSSSEDLDQEDFATLSRKAILDYFDKTRVNEHFGSLTPDPEVARRVRQKIADFNLGIPAKVCERYTQTGLDIVATAFRHTPPDAQVLSAICTFCTAAFDDGVVDMEASLQFTERFIDRRPQLHPLLDLYVDTLVSMRGPYKGYSATAMVANCLDFGNAEMFTRQAGALVLTSDSSQYIEYMRMKEGFSDCYACFIWPHATCPDPKRYIQAIYGAANFINLVNDMFSFYKEEKAGETWTYVHNYARVHDLTVPEALEKVKQLAIDVVHRIRGVLGEGPERDAWESFAAGYTQFHLQTARYQLQEILPEYF
ncbi:isoprenoid synthase domain-containing protein [Cristinia sonorae]|uniref:Isoprenoid synthase domain-containing protein n=1 Tax=Cristinia sonorae TaxID=1940300 RepID=A0A8K0UNV1_9AGAR|nr:isoprenoid synthase domain-containing protein [Cristinia sonorae]